MKTRQRIGRSNQKKVGTAGDHAHGHVPALRPAQANVDARVGLLAQRPAFSLGPLVQMKLEVGAVDDPLEREADAMADRAMSPGMAPMAPGSPSDSSGAVRRDAPEVRAGTEEDRREFQEMQARFFRLVGEQMAESILGKAGFAQDRAGQRQRPTTADEALRVTAMWGVTRDTLVASLPDLSQSLQGRVLGSHGSDTLAAQQQSLIDAMTPDGQQAYQQAMQMIRQEPFWRRHLDQTTVFIFPDLSGANRYAGYTQRGTERDAEGNESTAYIVHISKDALEAGNVDSVVANLVHELSHTLDVGAVIGPSLGAFHDELAGLLADHPDIQALRQGAADEADARDTHLRRIRQILYEHTGYAETEVFVHLQQLTHQPDVSVDGGEVASHRYILATVEGYVRSLRRIGVNPTTLDNILDALGRRTAMLYDRRIAAAPAGSTLRASLTQQKRLAELTLSLARNLAEEEEEGQVQRQAEGDAPVQDEGLLQRQPIAASATGGPAPAAVRNTLRAPGQPLGRATRLFAESRFGRDFGAVRVHADPGAANSARTIRARAFTSGNHIAFAAGLYAPHTPTGMRLLAHELSHVVQQGNGSQPVARRAPEDDAGLAVPAAPAVSLTNARFSSIPRLQGLASGGDPLSKKDNGDPVLAVQQALLDLGYSLLRYHDDGKYGDETGGAISQFRTDQKDPGTELTGTAMIVLDRVAPPQGVAQEHFFDYDRLFADGRLEFAVAIGYDEGLSHEGNVIAMRDWLTGQGFAAQASAQLGIEKFEATRDITYQGSDGKQQTRKIVVGFTMITPAVGASKAFLSAINMSDVTLYLGHARGGLGPDFDDKHKAEEQVVLGAKSSLHDKKGTGVTTPKDPYWRSVASGKTNDLEEMAKRGEWNKDRYRIWFFAACTSLNYLDEIRNGVLPAEMTRQNLDVLGTTKSIPIAVSITPLTALIEGLMTAQTMEQIVREMQNRLDKVMVAGNATAKQIKQAGDSFFREGAGDNPTQ